jgi:chemotaxis-related protein WspB
MTMTVLTFRAGAEPLALNIRSVREVLPRVNVRPVSGSPDWLAGVFVYRGDVIPVIDLHRLTGAGECPPHLSSRIILVRRSMPDGNEQIVGLLATQVADIREILAEEPRLAGIATGTGADLGPVVADGNGTLRLVDPDRLLPAAAWERLLTLPAEADA